MTAWAKVGAKVVCVDDGPCKIAPPEGWQWVGGILVQKGETYVIREVIVSPRNGRLCIKLEGIMDRMKPDYGYDTYRFRPLITQEQDIAMFKSLLTDTPINETVN